MKFLSGFLFLLSGLIPLFGQNRISGTVTSQGNLIIDANVYLKNTYDGSSSNKNGTFKFDTEEVGVQILVIEAIGFETLEEIIKVDDAKNLKLELFKVLKLEDAIITAGRAISSSDTSLKPIDVVTTAGSLGDPIGALRFVPGTQNVAEDGRLFVRGGDATETNIYIDKMLVFSPYNAIAPNTPTRGRFSPFLFNGINFNTGGYQTRYFDALSGILEFETIRFPKENSVNINLFTLGAQAAFNKKWENDAISANTSYINLGLYNAIFNSRDEWLNSPQSISGEMVYRKLLKKGILKTYIAYADTSFDLLQENINFPQGFRFRLDNSNLYANSTLNYQIAKNTDAFLGASFGYSKTDILTQENPITDQITSAQFRAEANHKFNRKMKVKLGSDFTLNSAKDIFDSQDLDPFQSNLDSNEIGLYSDFEIYPFKNFGLKTGLRLTRNTFLNKNQLDYRLSAGYKKDKHNFSASAGSYSQTPEFGVLQQNSNLDFMHSNQYIVNYAYKSQNQNIRIETYYKDYFDLIRYDSNDGFSFTNATNSGSGFARGIDFFWQNKNSHIKNLEYWLTYSYIDSERISRNFPTQAQPNFIANHKASFIGKYWVTKWRSMIGITYQYQTGRPFTNANTNQFLAEKTPYYHQIDISWAYLLDQQKILFFAINNVTGFNNVLNYRYANELNISGTFDRQAITPQNNQFFLVGFLWTISTDKSQNQLNNL